MRLLFNIFVFPGAKVHTLVKTPGGHFTNAEIEQVKLHDNYNTISDKHISISYATVSWYN